MKIIPASEVEKLRVVVFRDDVVTGQWLQEKLDALLAYAVELPEPGHAPGCGYFPDESPCTCGLEATFAPRPIPDDKLKEEGEYMRGLSDGWVGRQYSESSWAEFRKIAEREYRAALRKEGVKP